MIDLSRTKSRDTRVEVCTVIEQLLFGYFIDSKYDSHKVTIDASLQCILEELRRSYERGTRNYLLCRFDLYMKALTRCLLNSKRLREIPKRTVDTRIYGLEFHRR